MDWEQKKKDARWFFETLFRDEAIRPRPPRPEVYVPSLIRTARSLETGNWQSVESLFLKQGKLLADFEDDYPFETRVVRYYPTYRSLSDEELRGYFTWRTRLREGQVEKTSLSFAFLYIYELLNQISVASPLEGYRSLEAFRDAYGPLDSGILGYLSRWMVDYAVYYGLDPNLLADTPQVVFDRSVTILENIHAQSRDKVLWAVKQLAPKWLARSKFYAAHPDDCDTVIFRVLGRMTDHYAARCKKTLVEQYFGSCREYQVRLFDAAVFCDPLKVRNLEYTLDERCVYRCRNGLWSVRKHPIPPRPSAKLNDLLKTIDAVMREAWGASPIRPELDTKWILKLIREEVQALLAEKQAEEARKITIDYGQLAGIRRDAAITREKLLVEEELEEEPEILPEPPAPAAENDTPLTETEYRLMQCLLYGRDLGWVQGEGHILSVLLDSINDKLYDAFLDAVVDDTPAPVEDYIDKLKEMVHP